MNIEILKGWLREQDSRNQFAKFIKDGTTVYFSDELAACHDMMIVGFGESEHTIVLQEDVQLRYGRSLMEISIKTWTSCDWEVWYVDSDLKWLIVANQKGRKKYDRDDLIQSDRIDFEFRLNQVS